VLLRSYLSGSSFPLGSDVGTQLGKRRLSGIVNPFYADLGKFPNEPDPLDTGMAVLLGRDVPTAVL
jgi:hypothetical protein